MLRPVSSTRVSTETHAARSTSTKEKKLTSPPSRRSFAKRSPSTVLASRNLRRKRSPKGFRPSLLKSPTFMQMARQGGNLSKDTDFCVEITVQHSHTVCLIYAHKK